MSEVIVKMTSDHVKVKGGEYAQDIVRCKECKKAFDAEGEIICNHLSGMVGLNVVVNADDFCSYGSREGE